MLSVTSSAAEAIRGIASAIPDAAGIRLAPLAAVPTNGSRPATGVEAQPAARPEESDEVLEGEHAQLFVDRSLVPHLDDKVLDADVEGARTTFVLRPKG